MFSIYEDIGGEWRWRFLAKNGRIMADSAESYTRKADAVRAAERFILQVATAVITTEVGNE